MKLENIALVAICVVGAVVLVIYAAALFAGMVATFPYGLPVLAVIGVFVFICVAVLVQRLNNKEDDYYEKNIHE